MVLVNGETASAAASGFSTLPVSRQIGILVGLAASIAIGVAVAFWSMEPSYRPLYSGLSGQEASEVLDKLQSSGISFKLDRSTGAIMVPADDVHSAKLKLAADGLPRGGGRGFEFLSKKNGFGTSQYFEVARYKHALESELARTISNINNIKSARVHLAIPKQSVFVRDKRRATASVFIDLYSGAELNRGQVASVVHIVSSSVPGLKSNDVTVVDEDGKLLTEGSSGDDIVIADRLFNYKLQVEESYAKKIQDILNPMLGLGKVKARVTADIDFTSSAQTRETFNPDLPALRSEQIMEEKRFEGASVGGVPGSLSNQPPVNPTATTETRVGSLSRPANGSGDMRVQATKNYELDKTISHTQQQPGRVRRLTVAVVVDDMSKVGKTGKVTKTALTEKQLADITAIVKNAIGFNAQRGDSVNVINTSFAQPAPIEALPVPEFWEQSWFWDVIKQVIGGVFLLLLVFGVLMPTLRSLASKAPAASMLPQGAEGGGVDGALPGPGGDGGVQLPGPMQSFDDRMQAVKSMAGTEPKRVAQVVKTWVDG